MELYEVYRVFLCYWELACLPPIISRSNFSQTLILLLIGFLTFNLKMKQN